MLVTKRCVSRASMISGVVSAAPFFACTSAGSSRAVNSSMSLSTRFTYAAMGRHTAVRDLNASSSMLMYSDVRTRSRDSPEPVRSPSAASSKPARAVRWKGCHVSLAVTGLPNPPCCLTEERAAAVSASSSTSLRYVPLRPMNLAPSSALSSSPAPVFPARATVETRLGARVLRAPRPTRATGVESDACAMGRARGCDPGARGLSPTVDLFTKERPWLIRDSRQNVMPNTHEDRDLNTVAPQKTTERLSWSPAKNAPTERTGAGFSSTSRHYSLSGAR